MDMPVYLYAFGMCTDLRKSGENIGFQGSELACDFELPRWILGTKIRYSGRKISAIYY